jgi:lipopolysaccharide assembly protein A
MRFIWFVIFLIFVAIIGVFAFENSEPTPINYRDQNLSVQTIHLPMSVLIGGIYVLGMLTGWTVIGFLKRTVQHVAEGRKS